MAMIRNSAGRLLANLTKEGEPSGGGFFAGGNAPVGLGGAQ